MNIDFTGWYAVLPLYIENTIEGGFELAEEMDILVQPVVDRALIRHGEERYWDGIIVGGIAGVLISLTAFLIGMALP